MGKVKATLGDSKGDFGHPKNGSVNKKKNKKFKKTPTGKVALINGSQVKNNAKQVSQKNGNNAQKSPKSKMSPKAGASNKNRDSPKRSLGSKVKVEEENEDDSDDDINEGITIKEELSAQEDEVDDSDSSDEDAVPNIFGTSLAEETDDSDKEFDANDDNVENQGVKMFKGVKKGKKESKKSNDDDEEEDDDDDDDEEEDESTLGLSDLLGESIKESSDDEEFLAIGGSNDEDEDEDESDDEVVDQSLNSSTATSTDDDEDDDEDDDDNDDSSPDLTALLGNSLADESDDEDFEGDEDEEDEDISDEDEDEPPTSTKKLKTRKTESTDDGGGGDDEEDDSEDEKNESHDSTGLPTDDEKPNVTSKAIRAERDKRTIFIGNVPKDTKVQRLTSEFKKFGAIDTVRIRGIIPENPKMPLKVAAITKKYHPKSTTICAFITFKNEESVNKALVMNGKKLDGNYLRVDSSDKTNTRDKKKSVFLGNLPFTIEDNEVWEAFKDCGRIESVRIVRDRNTGLGRGFGYINFESEDGAALAMDLNGTTIQNRQLRVKVSLPEGRKKQRAEKKSKKRQLSGNDDSGSPKKMKTEDSEDVERATHNSVNAVRRTKKGGKKRSQGEKQRVKSDSTSPQGNKGQEKFQGQTADAKKKPKRDKTAKKKEQMAAKLLAKSKKPSAN